MLIFLYIFAPDLQTQHNMNTYFEDFTEDEYAKYSELFNYNTELEDGKIRVWGGEDSYLILAKRNNSLYVEVEEDEDEWAKLEDLDQLIEDVKNGVDLYYDEYC